MIGGMHCSPASVMVIEKHPLMREALCAAIADEPDLKVGMHAASGAEVLQMLKIVLPDIIIFALGNPGWEELKTLKTLCESLPQKPILVLTSTEVQGQGQEQAALEAGAQVVMTKAASRGEIIHTLREMRRMNSISHHQNILDQEANGDVSHS
jgi:DNA-binding NarL/FixJ family response regulator